MLRGIEETGGVEFTLRVPSKGPVLLVGDFNDGRPDVTPMVPEGDVWKVRTKPAQGYYQYGFYIRGAILRDSDADKEDVASAWP